jgi:hypothetical protein
MDDQRRNGEVSGAMNIAAAVIGLLMIVIGVSNGQHSSILYSSLILGGSLIICAAVYAAAISTSKK